MFAPKKPWPHPVPNFNRIVALTTGSMAPSRSRSMRAISPLSRTPAAHKEAVETNWALPVAPDGSTKPPQHFWAEQG
jgi:hypothetical protein